MKKTQSQFLWTPQNRVIKKGLVVTNEVDVYLQFVCLPNFCLQAIFKTPCNTTQQFF